MNCNKSLLAVEAGEPKPLSNDNSSISDPTEERIWAELKASGIADDVIAANLYIAPDLEIDPYTNEVISTPLADALGRKFTRFGHQARYESEGILFQGEDGLVWQGKLYSESKGFDQNSKRSGKYLARTGGGDKPFLADVPWRIVLAIAEKYGIEPPQTRIVNYHGIEIEETQPVWEWVKDNPQIEIVLTEGAKKALAAISQGVLAIALYGCNCGVDPVFRTLKAELLPYGKKRKITIAFDQDTKPSTIKKVSRAKNKIARAIIKAGGRPHMMEWEASQGKGIDDVIVADPTIFRQSLTAAKPFFKWQLDRQKLLDSIVSLRVNSRYLSDAIKSLPNHKLIAINSLHGTGKTALIERVAELNKLTGTKTLTITHRVQLTKQLAERLGLDYRTKITKENGIFGHCLVIDSLHPYANPCFNPEEWEGATVFIDEFDQVLWHLLASNTCRKNRGLILQSLRELFNVAGQIIIASADLDKRHIDYALGLLDEPTEPYIIVNDWKPETKRKLFKFASHKEHYTVLKQNLAKGEKALVMTGGQKDGSKWGSVNLESLIKKDFPHLKVLRVDAVTVAQPGHPAENCTANINKIFAQYDVVICSPTVETGVSIEIEHFDGVYCFASGSQTVFGVSQTLERYRIDVPRYFSAPDQALFNRIGNGSSDPYALKFYVLDMATNGVKLTEPQEELWDVYLTLNKIDNRSKEYGETAANLETWANLAAEVNLGLTNYSDEILELVSARYEIKDWGEILNEQDVEQSGDDAKASAKSNLAKYCQAVSDAELLDDSEYKIIAAKKAKTERERLSEKKTELTRRYAVEDIDPSLVELDYSPGFYSSLRLHYYLTVGREYLQKRDQKALGALVENGGKPFITDVAKASLGVKIGFLDSLKIAPLLEPGRQFDNETPELVELKETTLKDAKDIRNVTGVGISPDPDAKGSTPINLFRRYLALFGMKLDKVSNGNGITTLPRYRVILAQQYDRTAQFDRWLERDRRNAEAQTQQELGAFPVACGSTKDGKQVGFISYQDKQTEPDLLTNQLVQPPLLSGVCDGAIIPGSIVELTFNGDRHRVTAINGQTVVSKPIGGGETALTHIDWVRLAG